MYERNFEISCFKIEISFRICKIFLSFEPTFLLISVTINILETSAPRPWVICDFVGSSLDGPRQATNDNKLRNGGTQKKIAFRNGRNAEPKIEIGFRNRWNAESKIEPAERKKVNRERDFFSGTRSETSLLLSKTKFSTTKKIKI